MQGAPKRQVNADEMLAELKRALESSTLARNVPPVSGSRASTSSSPGGKSGRAQQELQRPSRRGWRSWKLTAGGLALAAAAAICAGFVFMNQAAAPKRALSVAPAEALVKAQNELARERSGAARAPIEGRRTPELLQAGNLAARPSAGAAPANNAPFPAREAADGDAPSLTSFGLEPPPPVFAPSPLDQAPALAPAERIGPDGAPIAPAPPAPASTGAALRAETQNKAAMPAVSPMAKPDAAKVAAAPTPASNGSAPQAETQNKAATPAVSPMAKPDAAKVEAPSAPASTSSTPQAETQNKAAMPAVSPMAKPDAAKVAAAPSAPASTGTAPREAPKPKAAPTEHASNEFQRRSTPKIESRRKPPERRSLQRLAKSAKASAKPVAEAERRSTEPPARPKEAEQALKPAPGAGAPAAAAPAAAPTVPQRLADGVTHAFGYLIHLPGALVSHPADSNADAH